MKRHVKSLLPKKAYDRVALKYKLLNIEPRLKKGLRRLTNISSKITLTALVAAYLMGYYPALSIPPVKQAAVSANTHEQRQEVIAASFSKPLLPPHPGYISTRFSRWHPGIDIATGLGMPIHPITDGVVEQVTFGFWGLGTHVIIDHQNGFTSLYAHMGRVFVKAGQPVTGQSILGEVGMTGHTSGPHTHLEITKDGVEINPEALLPKLPDYPSADLLSYSGAEPQQKKPELHKTLKPDFN